MQNIVPDDFVNPWTALAALAVKKNWTVNNDPLMVEKCQLLPIWHPV